MSHQQQIINKNKIQPLLLHHRSEESLKLQRSSQKLRQQFMDSLRKRPSQQSDDSQNQSESQHSRANKQKDEEDGSQIQIRGKYEDGHWSDEEHRSNRQETRGQRLMGVNLDSSLDENEESLSDERTQKDKKITQNQQQSSIKDLRLKTNKNQGHIIRNSKNWQHIDLNPQFHPLPTTQPQLRPSSPYQQQKHMHSSISTPIQTLNYKNMLRTEIKRTKQWEQQLRKQKNKNRYMGQLIQKLKQENNILRKLLGKQRNKANKGKAWKDIDGDKEKKQKDYCRCGDIYEERTPSSFITNSNKYHNKIGCGMHRGVNMQSGKMLK